MAWSPEQLYGNHGRKYVLLYPGAEEDLKEIEAEKRAKEKAEREARWERERAEVSPVTASAPSEIPVEQKNPQPTSLRARLEAFKG